MYTSLSVNSDDGKKYRKLIITGSLERKYPRRNDVRLLRSSPIHRIPHNNTSPRRTRPLPPPTLSRIIRLRRLSRRNSNSNHLPTRSPPHTIRSPRLRTSLHLSPLLGNRDSAPRRRRGFLPWMLSSRHPNSAIHGSLLHNLRGL